MGGPLRLADGRLLRVVFPGVPGGGSGPDFTGAMVDIDGDLVRGAVELHLRHSGWFAHGHDRDPAYREVALHVVAENDLPLQVTPHASGRQIPLLVLPAPAGSPLPGFVPPCAFARAAGAAVAETLVRMGARRLRMKANRAAVLAEGRPPGEVLLALVYEAALGPANRAAAQALTGRAGLAVLLEAAGERRGAERALAVAGALREAAAGVTFTPGGRPGAAPVRRLPAIARLVARWWPAGASGRWPDSLTPGCGGQAATVEGIGRGTALEIMANAVLPAALGTGAWPEDAVLAAWNALPAPGTYGRLRPLEQWLGGSTARPFSTLAALQGGLLLDADYCAKGACGRCPLSPPLR